MKFFSRRVFSQVFPKKNLAEFFGNHVVQWLFAFSVLGNGVAWGICAWFFHRREATVIMKYNAYLGIDPASVGTWHDPYALPIAALVFLGIHALFAWHFFQRKDRVMAHLSLFCGASLQFFTLIALSSIVLVNR